MLFLSTYRNRIDKKGRISIPAPFRAVLAGQQLQGLVAYASPQHRCIEACGMERIMKINARIELLDPYSKERDAFATTIFGESVQLTFDGEGRIVLPEALATFAGLADEAMIIGKGEIFEIWEPAVFAVHVEQARKLVQEKRHQLHGGGGKP